MIKLTGIVFKEHSIEKCDQKNSYQFKNYKKVKYPRYVSKISKVGLVQPSLT